ncbi:hypothetical protein BJY04DRAFT_177977 [Aspergillus karnatakaensis]|uniref:uncharacterized protein n=1 Tax=Aspergillus karnatakaensis TaxID=1810916 RepID=UPI003CCDA779
MTFGRRPQAVRPPGHRAPGPLVGYLNYADINKGRRPGMIPTEWTRDPYLVCVLLSIGQHQHRLRKSPQETDHTKSRVYW